MASSNEWVSVKKDLPAAGVLCLILTINNTRIVAKRTHAKDDGGYYWRTGVTILSSERVKAWAAIPDLLPDENG